MASELTQMMNEPKGFSNVSDDEINVQQTNHKAQPLIMFTHTRMCLLWLRSVSDLKSINTHSGWYKVGRQFPALAGREYLLIA